MTCNDSQPNDHCYGALLSDLIFECVVFWRIQHLSCRRLFWRHSFYPNSLSLPWWDAIREGREAYETALLSSFHWLLLWMIAGHLLKMNCEFSILKIKSEINPLDLGSYIWESWHIIYHTKPTQGGYLEVKGFQDPSTYSWEKYHITIQSNFWTHCIYVCIWPWGVFWKPV